jgi:phosphohistidine swiveling domain-containing protein
LFPLSADAPSNDEDLRVYLSFNISQGMTRPFTPMGLSGMRVFISGVIAAFTGTPPRNPLQGPGFITEAADRLYVDVTLALRKALGRRFLFQAAGEAEPHAVAIFEHLITDPRLSLLPTPRWRFLRALLGALIRTRMPLNLLSALLRPSAAWKRAHRLSEEVRQLGSLPANASMSERLATAERLLLVKVRNVLSGIDAAVPSSLLSFQMAGRTLGNLATESELQTVLRGVPHNPTTEMNLALWSLAQRVQADPAQRQLIQETPPAQLVQDYRQGSLPPQLQRDLQHFLATYGHRGVDEIDLGLTRWSEDPTYVLNILASYLQLRDPSQAPDAQYQRAVQEARDMVAELVRRTTRKNWLRGLLVRFCLNRVRTLSGMREMGRYILTLLLDRVRMVLWPVGESLARGGCLEKAEDIFFITLPEAHAALAGEDMRALVRERRATYEQEIARRHVPLVLLSDGTEPPAAPGGSEAGQDALQGTPASPGVVTAPARVILDPHGAHLEPGEILVAPTTDPGWTPLFLNAGGLVMEMGGAMSHGVIVAREYGIPAVVGVHGATERIATGSRITVDGTAGTIVLDAGNDA